MPEFPDLIRRYLERHFIEYRSPAYLQLDAGHRIQSVGGTIQIYRPKELATGTPVEDCFPFLEGFFPLKSSEIVLPHLEIQPGIFSEVHLIDDKDSSWVILLNLSEESHKIDKLLQRENQLKLQESKALKDIRDVYPIPMESPSDIIMLENVDHERYRLISRAPEWFETLFGHVSRDEFSNELLNTHPFLENFLELAESHWKSGESGYLKSSVWTESDSHDQEYNLEASAITYRDKRILIIEQVRMAYELRRELLQKAREKSLAYDRLIRTETRLRQSENRLRMLVDHIPAILWTTDRNLVITSCSGTRIRGLGLREEDINGQTIEDFFSGYDSDSLALQTHHIALAGVPSQYELSFYDQIMHCYIEPLQDEEDQILGTIGLAFDITERIQAEDSRIRMKEAETRAEVIEATNLQLLKEVSLRMQAENQLEKSLLDIQQVLQGVIQAISMTVEIRDPYTAGHQRRVSDLAYAIARQMKLSDEQADIIRMAGLLHDIGKVMVPAEILSKPGKLNLVEFSLIQMHPQVGYDILKSINFPWPIARIVHQHHEKLDGSGYPLHETKDNILLEAQILSVADMVEAIASHRPYRPSLGIETALEEIRKYQGVQLNSEAVDACITSFQEGLFAFT